MRGGYDLHTHTVCSDGTTTPSDNVRDAVALGLEGIAVTDHDTVAGVAEARDAAAGTGLEVIGGTEFSAELGGLSVHILGYWIDADHPPLATELARLGDERTDRARRIVERFHALGVPVAFDRVVELAGEAPIGRPHIAAAVVETGAVDSLTEVFDRYLADGGPAYVEKHALSPVRAVELLTASGGVAVLAHPGLYGSDETPAEAGPAGAEPRGLGVEVIDELAAAGMAGIEADHPDHTDEQRARYRELATRLGLLTTAGSDYHGEVKSNRLGSAVTPRVVVEALRERAR